MTLKVEDSIVAGGPSDFMEVRKFVLHGANREIGRFLASYGRDRLGIRKMPGTDPAATRAQRRFMAVNWPQHMERMIGAADALGLDLGDDTVDLSYLLYDLGAPGCSVIYYPPGTTADGHGYIARNLDYSTGTYVELNGWPDAYREHFGPAPTDLKPMMSRPHLIETHPDSGYPSLVMNSYDILAGCTEGLNAPGLCVAILSDSESHRDGLSEPLDRNGVGLNEIQTLRFLLETCATAAEAQDALLGTHQVHLGNPVHFLVADASGDGFVFEWGPTRNIAHITPAGGEPLPVTNHLIYPHDLPDGEATKDSVGRLCKLDQGLAAHKAPYDRAAMRAINAAADALKPPGVGQYASNVPSRTLWFALYDIDARAMGIEFYLGEADGQVRRSAAVEAVLNA